jgi:hypothetical protein
MENKIIEICKLAPTVRIPCPDFIYLRQSEAEYFVFEDGVILQKKSGYRCCAGKPVKDHYQKIYDWEDKVGHILKNQKNFHKNVLNI